MTNVEPEYDPQPGETTIEWMRFASPSIYQEMQIGVDRNGDPIFLPILIVEDEMHSVFVRDEASPDVQPQRVRRAKAMMMQLLNNWRTMSVDEVAQELGLDVADQPRWSDGGAHPAVRHPELDQATQDALGPDYADRWIRTRRHLAGMRPARPDSDGPTIPWARITEWSSVNVPAGPPRPGRNRRVTVEASDQEVQSVLPEEVSPTDRPAPEEGYINWQPTYDSSAFTMSFRWGNDHTAEDYATEQLAKLPPHRCHLSDLPDSGVLMFADASLFAELSEATLARIRRGFRRWFSDDRPQA